MNVNSARLQRLLKERFTARSASAAQTDPGAFDPMACLGESRRKAVLQQTLRDCVQKKIKKTR